MRARRMVLGAMAVMAAAPVFCRSAAVVGTAARVAMVRPDPAVGLGSPGPRVVPAATAVMVVQAAGSSVPAGRAAWAAKPVTAARAGPAQRGQPVLRPVPADRTVLTAVMVEPAESVAPAAVPVQPGSCCCSTRTALLVPAGPAGPAGPAEGVGPVVMGPLVFRAPMPSDQVAMAVLLAMERRVDAAVRVVRAARVAGVRPLGLTGWAGPAASVATPGTAGQVGAATSGRAVR